MTVHISSGKSGWGNYVLYGTKEKPRDSEKVEFIEGDIELGDRLCESNNYEESYYKIVLSFDKKVDRETALNVYEDFKKEFFVGLDRDEYHIDTVLHRDTDYDHFHMRIPKQNLKTDTHLQLYMDKLDRPRKQLIQDHLSLKYGFEIAREKNREIFKEEAHEYINKWREEHNQKPFDFKTKQGQKEAEAQINGYLSELIKSGLIEKREDITTTLKELGLNIVKENGLDIKKDFAYTTVSNETGKMRIKGEIHHDRFYINNQKDRSSQIDNNRRIIADRGSIEERAKEVRRELNNANEKRYNKVSQLFKSSRARAEAEHSKTLENGRVESINTSKPIKSNNRTINRNTNTKTTNEIGAVHREQKLYSNGRKQLSTIQPKRVDLRQTKTSLLLQNKIKERANERLINETIRRIREQREVSETALQRARNEREALQRGIERDNKELQNRVTKIANYYDKIRTKVVTTINEVKESIKDRLEKIKEKYLPKKENQPQQKDHLKAFVEQYEANQGEKSDSSNIQNVKKSTGLEKFKQSQERIREKEKIKEVPEVQKEPSKKKSFQRQR